MQVNQVAVRKYIVVVLLLKFFFISKSNIETFQE